MTWIEIYEKYLFKLSSKDLSDPIIIGDLIFIPKLVMSKIDLKPSEKYLSFNDILKKCKISNNKLVKGRDKVDITEHLYYVYDTFDNYDKYLSTSYVISSGVINQYLLQTLKELDFFISAELQLRNEKIEEFLSI